MISVATHSFDSMPGVNVHIILDICFANQIKIVIYFKITVVFGCRLSASMGNLLKVFSHY